MIVLECVLLFTTIISCGGLRASAIPERVAHTRETLFPVFLVQQTDHAIRRGALRASAIPSAMGSYHVIRKEAGLFCRTSSSVRLCWELEEPKGPKGSLRK